MIKKTNVNWNKDTHIVAFTVLPFDIMAITGAVLKTLERIRQNQSKNAIQQNSGGNDSTYLEVDLHHLLQNQIDILVHHLE